MHGLEGTEKKHEKTEDSRGPGPNSNLASLKYGSIKLQVHEDESNENFKL